MSDTLTLFHKINTKKNDDGKYVIQGYAIHPGKFNKIIEIPEEELENLQKSLEGASLTYDHNHSILSVIGKVNDTEITYDDKANKKGIKYVAEIDTTLNQGKEISKKIEKGYINACSIGFYHDSYCSVCGSDFHECDHWFDEAHIIARNCEIFELSLVLAGADPDATTKSFNAFKKQFYHKKGGNAMEKEKDLTSFIDKINELSEQIKELKPGEEGYQAKIDEINQEILRIQEEFKKELEKAEEKINEIDEIKEEVSQFGAVKEKIEELSAKEKMDRIQKLANKELELGMIKEEALQERIEELFELEEKSLAFIEDAIAKFEKIKNANKIEPESKIKEIQNLNKEEEIESEDIEQRMVHTIFRYDTVFKEDGNKTPGISYMGLRR